MSDDDTGTRLAKLRILDKEVTIACKPGEEDDLKRAAAYIDGSMRELKSRNNTSSIEKIAIVTAINTADALLKSQARQAEDSSLRPRIEAMSSLLGGLVDDGPAGSIATGADAGGGRPAAGDALGETPARGGVREHRDDERGGR